MKSLARPILFGAIAAVLAAAVTSCGPTRSPSLQEREMREQTIEEVQDAHTEEWMSLPGVVGIGIGQCEGEPCIRVFLSQPSPEAADAIPAQVDGYPVELEVTGEFCPR